MDLRDFPFMPLDVQRLRDSDLASDETPEACWAAVLLWCAAWHQVPAGSIPDSDDWQAKHAGYKAQGRVAPGWRKVRAGALRGWVACSDGRLYHPVIAEKAADAWTSKLMQRWRTECSRIKKHNQRHYPSDGPHRPLLLPEFEDWRAAGCPQGHSLPVPEDKPPASQGHGGYVPGEKRSKRQGEGQGQGQGEGLDKHAPRVPEPPPPPPPDPPDSPPTPTAAGAVCLALRAAGITSVNPSHPDLLALLDAGATEDELVAIVPSALGKGDPFAWLLVAAANRRRDAAQRAKGMHTGPLSPAPTPTEPAWRTEQRAATTAFAGRYAAKPATAPAAPAAAEVIDATTRLVG